jgi:hypothetical protein
MTRHDLLTGEPFLPKRINQKFISAENRIAYHNQKANELRQSTAFIDKPLHVNLRILNEVMKGKREKTLHKQFLLGKGFSFLVHNQVVKYQDKNHFSVYQYIIITGANDMIKIVCND